MYIRMEVHLPEESLNDKTCEQIEEIFNKIVKDGLYYELGSPKDEVRVDDFEFEGD